MRILSSLPGVRVRTVVSEGEDGLLVEPGQVTDLTEKIRWLLDRPEQRRALGARGRAKVEARYTWARAADRLEEVYQAALANSSVLPAQSLEGHVR